MFEKVQRVFSEVLKISDSEVRKDSTIDNLKGWDSMTHLELILALENEFKVEFLPHEIILLNSVQKILEEIRNKELK